MDPSLLDYARFHGIASDHTAIDPLSHIDSIFNIHRGDSLPQHIFTECETRLRTARTTLDSRLREEKLRASKESARFLTAVIREIEAGSITISWDELLPDFHLFDDARVETITFPLERETDVRLSKRPLRYRAEDIEMGQPDDIQETLNASNLLHGLRNGCSLLERVKKDKLKVSKGCFSFIQSVKGNDGPSAEELEDILWHLLEGRYNDHISMDSPELLPLSTDCFPSSPAPIPVEHMLPSPVSSTDAGLDSYRRRTTSSEKRAGSCKSEAAEKRPMSSCPIRATPQECLASTGGDKSSDDTSVIDIELPDGEDLQPANLYTKSEESIIGATSEECSLSVDKTSTSVYESVTSDPSNVKTANNDHRTIKRAMASSSEGADLTTERHTVAKKRRQNSSNISSKTKDHTEYLHSTAFNGNRQPSSQHLLSHTTAIAEKRFPKRQTISNQEPPPNFQDQSHGAGHQTASTQRGPDAQPRLKLGSLSSFLETRGRGQKRQIPAKSPYFTSKDVQAPGQPSNDIQASVQEDQPKTNTVASKTTHTSLIQLVQAPRTPANHEGIVLFTSTALLKTHPRVLQCLEGLEHPPKLVYRDYAKSSVTPKHQTRPQPHYHQIQTQTPRSPLPIEADIILSPKTGIILTISQATIQLYLPGHKSTLTEAITNTNTSQASIKSINSPLRESIFRLSSRYEHLYIFITHNPEQSKHSKNRLTNLHLSADKHLLASLTSLNAFCTSLSNSNPAGQSQYQHASITPLLIPFTPESVANWILALAHNHICVIPPSIPHFGSEPGYRIAFTPVNPQPQLAGLLGDSESIWELFLRRAGLNPFAARVVLAVLGRGIEDEDGRYGVGCLSRFVEMSAEERRGLFGGIIGGKILKRVESLIERDWQCDWALRFDDEIE